MKRLRILDTKLNYAIPSHEASRYQHPHNEEDIITEAYTDYIRGPWEIRTGKQIVVWGETDIQRTVDVVNPLDLRYGSPGVFSWAELKKGIWMIRGFYTSQLPGNLLFEFIYNPGYYAQFRLPVEGTHWGPSPANTNPVTGQPSGIYNWTVTKKWKDDAPKKWAIENWELGFRLRGFTYNIDWTLLYYNSLADAPVVTSTDNLTIYSNAWFNAAFRSKDTGESINSIVKDPGVKVYDTKRYQLFGATMQTAIDALHGSIWRFEWFYEYGLYYNKGGLNTQTGKRASTGAIYGHPVKRDTFGFGLNAGGAGHERFVVEPAGRRVARQGHPMGDARQALADALHGLEVAATLADHLGAAVPDHVLEVAAAAGCDAIVTYNKRDFKGIEKFGIRVLDPKEFLSEIGVIK